MKKKVKIWKKENKDRMVKEAEMGKTGEKDGRDGPENIKTMRFAAEFYG